MNGVKKLRYVILHHTGYGQPHFDLMFETFPGSALATWRSESWPVEAAKPPLRLANHRPAYLTYEGPVSNDRGTVRQTGTGTHLIIQNDRQAFVTQLDTGVRLKLAPLTSDK